MSLGEVMFLTAVVWEKKRGEGRGEKIFTP